MTVSAVRLAYTMFSDFVYPLCYYIVANVMKSYREI